MYKRQVLECGDGSLYTGYTTDVTTRLAAHQAGSGAKYTKSHAPVRLMAQARFYSKERAMSAEALFKRLDRGQKDALLAKAADTPLEDVLRAELPGFDEDTAGEFVCRSLAENVDAVSYTHLDVYKRQLSRQGNVRGRSTIGDRHDDQLVSV